MIGFTDYRIDTVVKFGGSLLADGRTCKQLIRSLGRLGEEGHRLLIFPGGGPTDNTIEGLDREYTFHPDTHHRACARAQDQTGLMIADPSLSDHRLVAVEDLEEVQKVLEAHRLPVLLPSKLIFSLDPFERSWEITSDAMAAWFAWLVHAPRVVILTNVDGVHREGKVGDPRTLVRCITAAELASLGATAVDACTAPFLDRYKLDAWVLHGGYPERLDELLKGKEPLGTHIVGGASG